MFKEAAEEDLIEWDPEGNVVTTDEKQARIHYILNNREKWFPEISK